jgi:glycosyltransferase involved in cell wall biosynthesis
VVPRIPAQHARAAADEDEPTDKDQVARMALSKAPGSILPDSSPMESPGVSPADRFLTLWPAIQEDLRGLQDVVNQLSPTNLVKGRLVPKPLPATPITGKTIRAVMNRLPDSVSHLLIARWQGGRGGAETVTANLIAALSEHYRTGELCILAPDQDSIHPPTLTNQRIPVVALNDIAPSLSLSDRVEITDRILVQFRPPVVHSMNSVSAWINFVERGRYYARDSRLFGNIYSNLRLSDGTPAAYFFWQSLPETIDWMSGVIADNSRVVANAEDCFGLIPSHLERLHVVRTPVLGVRGGDPTRELRRFRKQRSKRSLWMSRIASEKRLDVLAAIAERCPDRQFSLYGSATGPVDLSDLASLHNVTIIGEFGRLADLPVAEFDSYVFTSSAEGMPVSLLEVAALGLPIVAPDVGGIGEFIDQETGWLVSGPNAVEEYVQALDEIHRSPAAARRRVTAAQRRLLERHTWKAYRESLARLPGYFGERR